MNKETLKVVGIFSLAIILALGSWYIKREFNYFFNYQGQVQEEVQTAIDKAVVPLEKRILILEKKINSITKKNDK